MTYMEAMSNKDEIVIHLQAISGDLTEILIHVSSIGRHVNSIRELINA